MIPGELYKHTVSEDADGAQESKYHNKRKLPLTHDERKNISKAKKAEKYSAPSSAAPVAVESTQIESVEVEAEPTKPVEAGDMDGLRQRLQVLLFDAMQCYVPFLNHRFWLSFTHAGTYYEPKGTTCLQQACEGC